MDLSKHLISKKAEQMTYKVDKQAEEWDQRIKNLRKA
jgi:tRNA A22 N-methylase